MTTTEVWNLWLKTLGLIGALLGAFVAIYKYTDTKKKEFYATFWNEKMRLYIEVSETVSILATTASKDEFIANRSKFWGFFYGRLSIVENTGVKEAMQKFAGHFPREGIPSTLPLGIGSEAYTLALALKEDLLQSWQHPFKELGG